jgi:TolB-like protein
MLRSLLLAGSFSLLVAGAAASQESSVVVLPFANGGSFGQDRENFEALQLAIPAMVASELSRHPSLRMVAGSAVAEAWRGQDLSAPGSVDATTAARLGKQLGARYVISGAFIDHYGRFRIDARLIDAETGDILKVAGPAPDLRDRRQLYDMIRSVAANLVAGTQLSELPAGSPRTLPTEALTQFGRGLIHEGRNEADQARTFYQQALDLAPDYTEARNGLQRLGPT